MAKLNVVVPAAGVIIDGVEYRKVDRAARVGDVVKSLVSATDIDTAAFYAIKRDAYGDLYYCDNVGARRFRLKGGHVGTYEVYEKVAKEPEKSVRLTVGDYARIIGRDYHNYAIGSVARIVEDARDRQPYKAEKADGSVGNWLFEYEVERATEAEFLEQRQPQRKPEQPTPSADEIVVHNGVRYRKVKRKADVGDTVIITSQIGHSHFAIGSVHTIKNTQGTGNHGNKYGVGQTYVAWEADITVLEPIKPLETEVKRNANVGERIRIVKADDKRYGNGDVLTVVESHSSGVFATTSAGKRCGVWHSEYVVLTEETPKPIRLKVGEYAKTVGPQPDANYRKEGDIVKITEDDGSARPFKTEHLDGSNAGWAYKADLVRATDAEVATAIEADNKRKQAEAETVKWAAIGRKPNEYKAGDIVRVTCGGYEGIKRGDIGEITIADGSKCPGVTVGGEEWYVFVELVTPVEQRFDRR